MIKLEWRFSHTNVILNLELDSVQAFEAISDLSILVHNSNLTYSSKEFYLDGTKVSIVFRDRLLQSGKYSISLSSQNKVR